MSAEGIRNDAISVGDDRKSDAKNRSLRTLGQSVVAAGLTFLGALGAAMTTPGFEFQWELVAAGAGVAVLTPVLAWLQRRVEK